MVRSRRASVICCRAVTPPSPTAVALTTSSRVCGDDRLAVSFNRPGARTAIGLWDCRCARWSKSVERAVLPWQRRAANVCRVWRHVRLVPRLLCYYSNLVAITVRVDFQSPYCSLAIAAWRVRNLEVLDFVCCILVYDRVSTCGVYCLAVCYYYFISLLHVYIIKNK